MNKDAYNLVSSLGKYFENKEQYGALLKATIIEEDISARVKIAMPAKLLADVQELSVDFQSSLNELINSIDLDGDENKLMIEVFKIFFGVIKKIKTLDSYIEYKDTERAIYAEFGIDIDVYYLGLDKMIELLGDEEVIKEFMKTL